MGTGAQIGAENALNLGAAAGRLFGGQNPAFLQNPTPESKQDMGAVLATIYGGNAFNPAAMETNALGAGIKAYHGSPYDFDKFDASKIGTGEGAQAYGHGLYFAENPEVAGSYKQPGTAQWKTLDVPEHPPGKMYEVNINASPDQFLDWDKPLSEQSASIRDPIVAMAQEHGLADPVRSGRSMSALMYDLSHPSVKGSANAASRALAESGIPGIRYLDQGSRGSGNGTYNYVVFPGNEHLVEIVKKYGIAGAATMLGMQQSDLEAAFGGEQPKQNALAY